MLMKHWMGSDICIFTQKKQPIFDRDVVVQRLEMDDRVTSDLLIFATPCGLDPEDSPFFKVPW